MERRSTATRLIEFVLAIGIAAATFAPAGCVTNPPENANSAMANSNTAAGADANGPASSREPIYAKEPDQYSETISINIEPAKIEQEGPDKPAVDKPAASDKSSRSTKPSKPNKPSGSDKPTGLATPAGSDQKNEGLQFQFDFARLGNDRRGSFQLRGLGQVIYLEHSGLKYIVLPGRGQYIELDQATLGLELPKLSLMTPSAVVEHLKETAHYYKLDAEDINGRPAVKYRFTGKIATNTQAGEVDTDSSVYLDETTGLPVRAEIVGHTAGGAGARVTLQMSNVQLNPDRASFEVPIGFKKVSSQELRQQVNSLADTMRIVALTLTQQFTPAPSPTPSAPPTTASPPRSSAPKP